MSKRRIMFNEDNTHQFYEYMVARLNRLTPEIAEEYIAQYTGSQITDYLINVNSLNSSFPSKVLTSYADKYLQKRENGIDVDYTDTHAKYYYESFVEDGYDMYAHWIELLRDLHITPWLSFRMNDCHDNFEQASMMLSDYYHEHKELRRITHHRVTGYYDNCFDYAKKEVRDRMLAYIDEALDRYDVDGIELDYIREQMCFSIGGEYDGKEIMTQFVRDVKAITDKYSEKRGKKIIIGVRVPRSPEDCLYEGFDVLNWAKEGLVKVVVASPRWSPTDNDIPVEFWKEILRPYKVEFAAAVELILKCCPTNYTPTLNTHETALASCYQYLCAGADFAYLFNYMHSNVTDYNDPNNEVMYSDLYKWNNYQQLIRNAGEIETASKCIRRHIPSYRDSAPMWSPGAGQCTLPCHCTAKGAYTPVRIRTGTVHSDDEVYLILGCAAEGETDKVIPSDSFEVYINSTRVYFVGTEKIHPAWTENKGYIFKIDPGILTQVNVAEIAASDDGIPFNVDFAEIRVIPKEHI